MLVSNAVGNHLPRVPEFYHGKSVFLTGAAGFVGSNQKIAQTTLARGSRLPNDNSSGWWRWNYGLKYFGPLGICGHNSEQHSLPQHRFRSHALVYGYNVPLWRRSMEHMRGEIQRSLRSLETQLSNMIELRAGIMSAWANIPQQCYQKLVESMPRRISALIRAKAGPTRY
ncbi:hypothetical protein AVEN_259544-1 [Araneus ventricosus]|uniref:Uncharacterized protein n=1 Tax=Araneus ventricosus TaxID=182803 RepID=A0A4Y2NVY4_ARAVE|nr:hypothetical protein AVEN_259544-1 [Araneus ventricosus]